MLDENKILADFLYGERSFEEGLYCNPDFYDILYSRDADFDKPLKLVEENIDSGSKILYLGCGTCLMLEKLEDNYEVVGVDVSTEMAESARERCS